MAALSPKAILEGRTSNRPPVALIVGLIVSAVCILLAMGLYLLMAPAAAVGLGFGAAVPTAVLLVGLVLLIDRLEPEPPLNLMLALAWGAGVAIVGALIFNDTAELVLAASVGNNSAKFLGVVLVAPIVEESFKGSLLLVLLIFRRQEIDGPTDGIVYASMAGIGFALVENVLYYMRGLAGGSESFFVTVFFRGVMSPMCHPLFTSMTGLAVAFAATRRGPARFLIVPLGWCAAVLLHAIWNFGASVGLMVFSYAFEFLVLVFLAIMVIRDRKRIIGLINTYLPSYIPSGLVQPNDVQMLGSMKGRKQARAWARSQGGLTGAKAMSDYQLAATELALLHKRAAHQSIEPHQFHQRRDQILSLMRLARDAFFQRMPQVAAPGWAQGSGGATASGFFKPVQPAATQLPSFPPPVAVPPNQQRPPQARPPMTPPPGAPVGPTQGHPPYSPPPGKPPQQGQRPMPPRQPPHTSGQQFPPPGPPRW